MENELTHKEKTNMKLKDMLDLTQMLLYYKEDEFLYPNSPAFYNTAHPSRPDMPPVPVGTTRIKEKSVWGM